MTLSTVALAVVAVAVLSGHVAPSIDDNNRYLKVTPLRDGFRFAYTVFFGEVPGAAERRQLDTNRDGRIDPGEAKRFGDHLAAQLADTLIVEIGGAEQRVRWTTVDVGLGTDAVAAGAFSVDMIAYLCAPSGDRVRVRDPFRIPRPGETEVKVEDSPGVTVTVARVGPAGDPTRDYRFIGPGGPLADDGLEVEWKATASAPALPAGTCAAVPSSRNRAWLVPVIAALAILAAAIAFWLGRRARAA